MFGFFFLVAVYVSYAYSISVDNTSCSSSKDGKTAICKVLGVDSAIAAQYSCTNQINGTWNCVEITQSTTKDHLNGIKDTLKKLLDLKSQSLDAVNNIGR